MKVSIVIPCFNQRDTITQTVLAVRKAPLPKTEIILVDDGSNDGTRTVLKCEVESIVDRVSYHGLNQGKGATLRDGFAAASGDIILVQDAALECCPSEYNRLLEPILSDKADAVFASRFINGPSRQVVNFWQTTGTKLLTLLSNMCANTKLTDIGSGYNAFRASIIRHIQLRASSVLACSQKSQPNWHGRAAAFAKWVLARIAGMDKKVSQCDGAMRCGPSTRFSNTTSLLARLCLPG